MIPDTTVLALGPGLIVTGEHKRQMEGNKSCGYVMMDPRDFLDLTTAPGKHPTKQELLKEALPLAEYNEFAIKGQNILPPWLDIETEKAPIGKVIGHEGRHRAAACVVAGIDTMPVFLIKREYGVGIWKVKKFPDDLKREYEMRFVEARDFPEYAIGQYDGFRCDLPLKTWITIRD